MMNFKQTLAMSPLLVNAILFLMIASSSQEIIETILTKHKLNHNQTAYLIKETRTVGIEKLSTCKVKLDDGKIIDLTSLDNPMSPRFVAKETFINNFI